MQKTRSRTSRAVPSLDADVEEVTAVEGAELKVTPTTVAASTGDMVQYNGSIYYKYIVSIFHTS